MTSGGTESIIMAVKTYRDWARATKGITEPEMSVCDLGRSDDRLIPLSGLFPRPRTQHLIKERRTLRSNFTPFQLTQSHARRIWPGSGEPCESVFAVNNVVVPHLAHFQKKPEYDHGRLNGLATPAIDTEALIVIFLSSSVRLQISPTEMWMISLVLRNSRRNITLDFT